VITTGYKDTCYYQIMQVIGANSAVNRRNLLFLEPRLTST